MAMSTGNDGEVKVEDAIPAEDVVKVEKKEPKKAEPPKPKAAAPMSTDRAAILFLAQRVLPQPDYETFKQLYHYE